MKNLLLILFLNVTLNSIAQIPTVGTILNTEKATEGYFLFSPNGNETIFLINNCGEKINTWNPGGNKNLSMYLLDSGNILHTSVVNNSPAFHLETGASGVIKILNWENEILWEYEHSTLTEIQHHDVEYLQNGNILMIVWEKIPLNEVAAAGKTEFLNQFWSEKILEIKPIGTNDAEIIWEWKFWDHLIQNVDSSLQNYGQPKDFPQKLNVNIPIENGFDWMHCNAISYNETLNQIVISSQKSSEIYIIDHSITTEEAAEEKGDFLFRWGNVQMYNAGDSSSQKFFRQHDVRWINEDQISVFNNGLGRPEGNISSADIITLQRDSNGNYLLDENNTFLPKQQSTIIKEATNPYNLYSANSGSAQFLNDGNVVICSSHQNQIKMLDPEGNKVWQYRTPIGINGTSTQGNPPLPSSCFRYEFYDKAHEMFNNLSTSASEKIELNPIDNCKLNFENVASMNETISIELAQNQILVTGYKAEYTFNIYNLQGALVQAGKLDKIININPLNTGVYIFQVLNNNIATNFKIVIL